MSDGTLPRPVVAGLLLAACLLVAWIRLQPLSLDGVAGAARGLALQAVHDRLAAESADGAAPDLEAWAAAHPAELATAVAAERARLEDLLRYTGPDGHAHVYLGDFDSYVWLRHARNYLRHGTTCDAVVEGECRDTHLTAPVGGRMRYARSAHIAAIVALHRVIALVAPDYPLPATAFLVPVVVGTLLILPAFGIARRLAGDLGGLCAAVVVGVNPVLLTRSVGSDNDVWNVALPLVMAWALVRALGARAPAGASAWTVAAAAVAAVHAVTWSGWVLTYAAALFGVAAAAAVALAHAAWRRARGAALRRAVTVLVVFWLAAGAGVWMAGAGDDYAAIPGAMLRKAVTWAQGARAATADDAEAPAAPARPPEATQFPNVFGTVSELSKVGLAGIAVGMGGPLVLFVGWLGLLVMLLPRRAWRWWHFAVLIGGNYLYRHLLTGPLLEPRVLVLVLALPLAVTVLLEMAVDAPRAPEPAADESGGRLIVALWFLAALFLAYLASRHVLLLAAPFALAFGVALGRLAGWLERTLAATRLGRPALVRLAVAAGLALALVAPVQDGLRIARTRLPQMHDAWWDAFTRIRETAARDAIVTTWWDYGHWAKYVAERRVTADGSTLRTHVPYWIGRALLAPSEAASVGLLRMLACGSDATPEPEGERGAYGKLRLLGLGLPAAHALVSELAALDRTAAEVLLTTRRFAPDVRADLLDSTHCEPPDVYLVLTDAQVRKPAWWVLGQWDPAAPEPTRLRRGFLTNDWVVCEPDADGAGLVCPIGRRSGPDLLVGSFRFPRADPAAGRLHVLRRSPDGASPAEDAGPPAVLVLATDTELEEHTFEAPVSRLAVLVDVPQARVLLGFPSALRATFTRLLFLDGRYDPRFEMVADQVGYADERVVTWKVRW